MTIFLQAAGAAVAEQPKTMGFGELFLAGGWLMWVLLVLGALGMTNLWAAVFADVGVSVIAICNAIRALRPPKE